MPATRAGRRLRAAILPRMRYHGVAVGRMPPADLQERVRPEHTALGEVVGIDALAAAWRAA